MKTTNKVLAALSAIALGTGSASALDAVVTAGETYTGTVTSVRAADSTLLVGSEAAPVAYRYSEQTTFVDPSGNAVTYESITPKTPVQIHYTMDGDVRRVERVVVRPPTVTETTTTVESVD